ncbi:MAG TPA: hypothetical protein VJ804_13975 [Acidimicrobiales bacterium]|nr:hypothetical protein [Acidimicrobiales bacterium]
MSGTSEERLRHAKLSGAAKGLRGAVWQADHETEVRHRAELPRVWERIDDVIALLGDPFAMAPPLVRAPGERAPAPDPDAGVVGAERQT